jgi:hypothetical protein
MYYPPAVFFDSNRNQFGLAWGTGNRQNLWLPDTTTGRFYVMIDNNLTATTTGLPFTAANLVALTPDGANAPAGTDYLDNPANGVQPGYYFELNPGERVLSEAFVLAGSLIFNSYEPTTATGGTNPAVCIDSGNTRLFVLNIENGNALTSQLASQGTVTAANQTGGSSPSNRYMIIGQTLALNITTAQNPATFPTASNPNPTEGTGSNTDSQQLCNPNSSYVQSVVVQIEKLMPSTCRFSNALISINLGQTSGQTQCVAAVPVCMIEKNWKEF